MVNDNIIDGDNFDFQADTESRRNQLMRDMAQLRLQVKHCFPIIRFI